MYDIISTFQYPEYYHVLLFLDVPIFSLAFHAYVPTFFISGMVFYLAVKFRSGLGAGMASGIVLFVLFIFNAPLQNTRYALYFNPFEVPYDIDPTVWFDWTIQNRAGLIILGGILIFGALRNLNNRERLLH